ncbi:MAG: CCA tRNA nucleotidyltransferase [Syntrophales bacterium]
MKEDITTADFEAAAAVVRRLKDAGWEAYFVGGCVRDFIRGEKPGDYDIATSARPVDVRKIFSRTIPVGESFGIMLVVERDRTYEVATFRTEEGYDDGRRPSRVSFATAKEDVQRRDFTINGLLMDPQTGKIIDYVNGRRDVERQLVCTIGDPERRFAEDRLRMLRAIRFAANLDFEIDPGTLAAISRNAEAIKCISAERICAELSAILVGSGARRGMELLSDSGLLKEVLPEIEALRGVSQPPTFHPEGDVWEHTMRMLACLPRTGGKADLRLAWGVLLHDVGKPLTRFQDERGVHFYGHDEKGVEAARKILARLRFSNQDMETILALVREHMMFMNVSRMRPARLKRFLRMPDFDLHLELHRLDCLGSHGMLDYYEFCLQKMKEYPAEELRPAPLVTGRDLIEMGFLPGPAFKEMLLAVEEAQLAGEITDAEGARELVRGRWGSGEALD